MKIRTIDQLSGKLYYELSWRRKELHDLKYFILQGSQGNSNTRFKKRVLSRCGIALLYAHWEGFVKQAGSSYLEFVSMQGKKIGELRENFLALIIHEKIRKYAHTKKASLLNDAVDMLINKLSYSSKLPVKNVVDTQSNLSSDVFKEILWCLGIDYSHFETKEKLIDHRLLERRNFIAHGEQNEIDIQDFLELHDSILEMMDLLRNLIENQAVSQQFARNSSEFSLP